MATRKSSSRKTRTTKQQTNYGPLALILGLVLVAVIAFLLGGAAVASSPAVVTASDQPSAENNNPSAPQAPAAEAPQAEAPAFPLAGSRFPAYADGVLNVNYDLFVETNGRYWQKWLKEVPGSCNDRKSHSVAFELPEGNYTFNGVEASLTLDVNRNGKGAKNPVTVERGNDLHFTVKLPEGADYVTAWVLVESNGGCSGGFDLWFLGE